MADDPLKKPSSDQIATPSPSKEGTMSNPTTEFQHICSEALDAIGDVPAAVRDKTIADLELRHDYPGEYAAWLDRYTVANRVRRLSREVLVHDRDLTVVSAVVAGLSPKDMSHLVMDYLDPLDVDLELPSGYFFE